MVENITEKGKVDSFNIFNTKKDGSPLKSPRYEVGLNGKKYSTFDSQLVDGLKVGMDVEMSLKKEEGSIYWQIDLIRQLSKKEVKEPTQDEGFQPADNLPNQKKTVQHMVLSDLTDEQLRQTLNLASEQNGSPTNYGGDGVFASSPFFYDTGRLNQDGSKVFRWAVVVYVRV
jgi:hypothetical protein